MPKKEPKSLAKRYKYQEEDKKLFEDVVFIVEATHHEQHQFWVDYFYEPRYEHSTIKNWEQVTMGRGITIGELDNRPIMVSVGWAILEGYRVMFYEAVSQVVDHKMVEEWIQHYSLDTIRWDNGHRWAHTDSSNNQTRYNWIRPYLLMARMLDPQSSNVGSNPIAASNAKHNIHISNSKHRTTISGCFSLAWNWCPPSRE